MKYYLAKCEPEAYSIDDLKVDMSTQWDGVRNYQARNNLREMEKGDIVLFYQSNAEPSGIVGSMEVAEAKLPDTLQFDKRSEYYDPKATKESPTWIAPRLKFKQKFKEVVSLDELRSLKKLASSALLRKGNRLSVISLTKEEYEAIVEVTK